MTAKIAPLLRQPESVEWATPDDLFARLDREWGPFTLDAAATPENAKCKRFFSQADDGLKQDWSRDRVWLNPPYGRQIGAWVEKAAREARCGALVCCLLPARTDTAWWHDYIEPARRQGAAHVEFLRGRVHFIRGDGHTGPAGFPSCVVVFHPWPGASP
jgi:phage N-6-adenine-methyltransferase